ncbi:uncharacterized protein LOC135101360 isoform X2 [Scylla paramamosain]|uniref:uncharacterized protein LOC135101360 isoform X2 n=1 Tax=Scylla paramamosain TaxID=85552 RepID=UPI00308306E6
MRCLRKVFTACLSLGNLLAEILHDHKLDHFLTLVVTCYWPHTLTSTMRVHDTIRTHWVSAQQLTVQSTIDGVDL